MEERNWAELHHDVLSIIFKKLGAIEILTAAQFVCKAWQQLSLDPDIWRCIDMTKQSNKFCMVDLKYIARLAVDRSEGCVEKFYTDYFYASNDVLEYIADRGSQLRCLRLISVEGILFTTSLTRAIQSSTLLEEFEMSHCSFAVEIVKFVGQSCPELRSFGLIPHPYMPGYDHHGDYSDELLDSIAFAIAKHMRKLRRLKLFLDSLTNVGLFDILDNCPDLVCLDIHECRNVFLDENLKRKCARIKDLRLPNGCIDDFDTILGEL